MSLTKPKINRILTAYHEYADHEANKDDSIAFLCHFLAYDCPRKNLIGQPLTDHLLAAIRDELGPTKLTLWSIEDWYAGAIATCSTTRDKGTIRADYLHFLLLDFATNGPFPQTTL